MTDRNFVLYPLTIALYRELFKGPSHKQTDSGVTSSIRVVSTYSAGTVLVQVNSKTLLLIRLPIKYFFLDKSTDNTNASPMVLNAFEYLS